jgi:hypothetical protein
MSKFVILKCSNKQNSFSWSAIWMISRSKIPSITKHNNPLITFTSNLHIYTHTHTHTYTHIYIHTYIYIYTQTYIYIHTQTRIYIHTYAYASSRTHTITHLHYSMQYEQSVGTVPKWAHRTVAFLNSTFTEWCASLLTRSALRRWSTELHRSTWTPKKKKK